MARPRRDQKKNARPSFAPRPDASPHATHALPRLCHPGGGRGRGRSQRPGGRPAAAAARVQPAVGGVGRRRRGRPRCGGRRRGRARRGGGRPRPARAGLPLAARGPILRVRPRRYPARAPGVHPGEFFGGEAGRSKRIEKEEKNGHTAARDRRPTHTQPHTPAHPVFVPPPRPHTSSRARSFPIHRSAPPATRSTSCTTATWWAWRTRRRKSRPCRPRWR